MATATRKRKPKRKPYRINRTHLALIWLVSCLVVFAVIGWFFHKFVLNYDFEGITPGNEPLRDFLPEEGYQRADYPPAVIDPHATAAPTPRPTPVPTAIPVEKYARLNKRLVMPEISYDVVNCGLSECRVSEADDNRTLVMRGWGYIEGMDAAQGQAYMVVSTKYGENHRFYVTERESGSSGVLHDSSTGTNLDQADFSCIVRIEDTYADGDYRLGVLVLNRETTEPTKSYARLDSMCNFKVVKGRITGFEGINGR